VPDTGADTVAADLPATAIAPRIGAGVEDGRPFRLNFLLHLDSDISPAEAFRQAVDLFVVAEQLGYDSGWVIHRHFRQGNEHVAAPLVLLAAVAARTTRIRLGTGVYVLPLEDPLVVAEQATVLDELSGRRVELGVGSGPFPTAWEAFDVDLSRRHELFQAAVARLHGILEGAPLNPAGERLHPPGTHLRTRLWQATTSDPARAVGDAVAAARAGDGLQLSRASAREGRQGLEAQAEIVSAYRQAAISAGHEPRVQISRAVYPHPSRAAAVAALTPGVRRWQSWGTRPAGVRGSQDESVEDYLQQDRALLGPPERLADILAADPALAGISDLLVSFVPGVPGFEEHIRLLTDTARDLAPLLGWHPAGR
jgi:alkanesulfonate monooxygenase SsuD/methylene tetrahydromethanopterin reductase-like flavin-dependent oxidoreductase (luciferase family)